MHMIYAYCSFYDFHTFVMDESTEARIIQMACGPVPKGYSRWTLRLLEEKAHMELDIPVGRETILETLKK